MTLFYATKHLTVACLVALKVAKRVTAKLHPRPKKKIYKFLSGKPWKTSALHRSMEGFKNPKSET